MQIMGKLKLSQAVSLYETVLAIQQTQLRRTVVMLENQQQHARYLTMQGDNTIFMWGNSIDDIVTLFNQIGDTIVIN